MKSNNLTKFALPAIAILLSGCVTNDSKNNQEEVLPTTQQNTYLSHAKMPQHFGFETHPTKDGIGMRGAARLHPNHMASKPFIKGNIPIISVQGKAARQKMKTLLDVTSPASWVEFTTSQKMGATFLGTDDEVIPYRGPLNTGEVPCYGAVIRQLRIEQLFMENVPLYVRMAMNSLGPFARGIQVPKVEAVMGYDILEQFEYIQFDFAAGGVMFSSTIPYYPHQALLMTEAKIKKIPHYGLAVEGAIFGSEMPILLDFAGDFHFARGDAKVNYTKQVSLGDIVYRQVPTLLLPISGTPPRAGRKMLEQYLITICPKKGVVYFELLQ